MNVAIACLDGTSMLRNVGNELAERITEVLFAWHRSEWMRLRGTVINGRLQRVRFLWLHYDDTFDVSEMFSS